MTSGSKCHAGSWQHVEPEDSESASLLITVPSAYQATGVEQPVDKKWQDSKYTLDSPSETNCPHVSDGSSLTWQVISLRFCMC